MSLTDYSALEQRIADAPEPVVLPKGTEVKARIVNIRTGIDKNEIRYFMPVFDVPGEDLVKEFSHFFTDLVDVEKLTDKQKNAAFRQFKLFAEAFGIDYSKPFDFEEFIELEGWVIVGVQKTDDYGEQNTVNRYIAK